MMLKNPMGVLHRHEFDIVQTWTELYQTKNNAILWKWWSWKHGRTSNQTSLSWIPCIWPRKSSSWEELSIELTDSEQKLCWKIRSCDEFGVKKWRIQRTFGFYFTTSIFFFRYHGQDTVEIRYLSCRVGCGSQKEPSTTTKEACIVHVGAVIHDYQREKAGWSRKCLWRKDCPGDLTSLNTDNVNFCPQGRP